jgi:hypothetical protein
MDIVRKMVAKSRNPLFNTVRSDYDKLEGVAYLSMNPVSHRNEAKDFRALNSSGITFYAIF